MSDQGAPPQHRTSQSLEERRLAMRVAVSFDATYSIGGQAPLPGRITEISRSGLRLLSELRLRPGTAIQVTFEPVIAAPMNKSITVSVAGTIARLVNQGGPPYDYGVEVHGDRDATSIMERTVLQMSRLAFDDFLGQEGHLEAPLAPVGSTEAPDAKDSARFDERRQFMRARVNFQASYSLPGRAPEPALVSEISRTGLRLRSGQRVAKAALIEVTFDAVFSDATVRVRRVCVRGQVARQVGVGGPPFEYGIAVLGDRETKATLQWAVLQVGLKIASDKRSLSSKNAPNWL